MPEINRTANVVRHLAQSKEDTDYATPYGLVSSSLRTQNAKARANAVELLVRETGLHSFDAETVARSVADLSQLKEAARTAQTRRYGQYEVTVIEVDVVTWRILPSLENIRFEGDRAWKPGEVLRYQSPFDAQPVLGLSHGDPDAVVRTLRNQTKGIWDSNLHSRSIPMRGIETPGLLSIARLALGDNEKIGILDATDGFSRTVGAQRGSGIDIDEVLFGLQREATENKLRNELIDLRDSGEADLDGEAGEVAAARLRCSVMPRAQIIVGYRKIGAAGNASHPPFDEVRRSIVGHIHLEPPRPFLDSTENALKARIALEAVHNENMMPPVEGLSAQDALDVLRSEYVSGPGQDGLGGLHPDEVLVLAADALVSARDAKRVRAVNAAVHSLTGKKPVKMERANLAADTAMRVGRIARGQELDTAFKGRRSTMQRVLAATTLKNARLTRRPVLKIRDEAIRKLREQRENLHDTTQSVSPDAAELGVLAVYCLVEGMMGLPGDDARPLLIRSNARIDGEYMPEPQQIIEKMVTSENGLQQLAQVILDVRNARAPRRMADGDEAGKELPEDHGLLGTEDLYRYKLGNWSSRIDTSSDPRVALDGYHRRLVEGTKLMKAMMEDIKRIKLPGGAVLVDEEGLSLDQEWSDLDEISYEMRTWSRTARRRAPSAAAAEADEDEDAAEPWTADEREETVDEDFLDDDAPSLEDMLR